MRGASKKTEGSHKKAAKRKGPFVSALKQVNRILKDASAFSLVSGNSFYLPQSVEGLTCVFDQRLASNFVAIFTKLSSSWQVACCYFLLLESMQFRNFRPEWDDPFSINRSRVALIWCGLSLMESLLKRYKVVKTAGEPEDLPAFCKNNKAEFKPFLLPSIQEEERGEEVEEKTRPYSLYVVTSPFRVHKKVRFADEVQGPSNPADSENAM